MGYVGSRGTHLYRSRDLDQANLASSAIPIRGMTKNTVRKIAQRRPYLGFGRLLQIESEGES